MATRIKSSEALEVAPDVVKGFFQNGVVQPMVEVEGREGDVVLLAFHSDQMVDDKFTEPDGEPHSFVKGVFHADGAHPVSPLPVRDMTQVMIVFTANDSVDMDAIYAQAWDELDRILEEYAVDTGIPDLAEEHDHYAHGAPKRSAGHE